MNNDTPISILNLLGQVKEKLEKTEQELEQVQPTKDNWLSLDNDALFQDCGVIRLH